MKLTVREIVIFGMLGAVIFVSKLFFEFLPNVHIIGVFTVAMTLVYRVKALIPLYIFIFITGFYYAFIVGGILWWGPYLYIWTILWAVTMLLPKKMPGWLKPIVYSTVCAIHGFCYGAMYAPYQALVFGFDFNKTIAWIISGLPWDAVHGVSNFFLGLLICPLVKVMSMFQKQANKNLRD